MLQGAPGATHPLPQPSPHLCPFPCCFVPQGKLAGSVCKKNARRTNHAAAAEAQSAGRPDLKARCRCRCRRCAAAACCRAAAPAAAAAACRRAALLTRRVPAAPLQPLQRAAQARASALTKGLRKAKATASQ